MPRQQKHYRHPLSWSHLSLYTSISLEHFVVILSFQRVFSLLNQIKVFWALIIGSVFRVSFDLSQGVMGDNTVISNLSIKGKFNFNLISCALKN